MIARKLAELFNFNCGIHLFYPAYCFDELGGPQKLLFFQSRVTKKLNSKVPRHSLLFQPKKAHSSNSLPPSKSPNLQCTLPPLACFIPPLRKGISKLAVVAACRLPRGCRYVGRFFYLALLAAQHRANHTSTMMFFRFVEPNCPPSPSIL